jgi:hypothetical protein
LNNRLQVRGQPATGRQAASVRFLTPCI